MHRHLNGKIKVFVFLLSIGACIFIKVTFINFVFILRVHILSLIDGKIKMFSLYLLSITQATPNSCLPVFPGLQRCISFEVD